tara:strand:- start:5529 stop:6326 length:798 start_codon:yes stop_codon:yes gene_type:complete
MTSFNNRLSDRAKRINSYLCVGIDISPELLGSNNLDDLISHSKLVVDATRDIALAYKPNFAFFERWGPKGFEWLEQLVNYIGEGPILIADAKRGDIGTTARQYAQSVFNYFGFDCVTLSPYLGVDSIDPFISSSKKGVFILCRTSNPSGFEFQNMATKNNTTLYESVALWAKSLNKEDNIGLVVGATAPEELSAVRSLAPELPLLIPGIGAQGGDLEKSIRVSNSTGIGIINVSRSISFAGNLSKSEIRKSAITYVSKMNEALND